MEVIGNSMHSNDRFLCGLQIYINLQNICLILFPKMSPMFSFFRISVSLYSFSKVTWRVLNNIAHNYLFSFMAV